MLPYEIIYELCYLMKSYMNYVIKPPTYNRCDLIEFIIALQLSVVDHSKYLGVILQSDLNWNKHVEQKVSKASSMLALIQRNLMISTIRSWYKALVRPQLEYASTVWSPWQQGLTTMIEKVQRHAARFVFNDYSYNSNYQGLTFTQGIQPIVAIKNAYKHSFLPSTIPIWNSLPQSVIESSSLQLFKSNLNTICYNIDTLIL